MTHYTVGYLDEQRRHLEVCVTAEDSFEARNIATQDIPYLHDHPNKIDCILSEGSLFSAIR